MENADELRNAVKSIRERAGLSVRAMAAHLGMSPSGYSHYEQRIKDKSLPPKIAASIANVVEPLGVPREEVYELTLGEIKDHSTFHSVLPTRFELDGPEENGQSLVPVYDVSASAGFGALVDYEEQTHSLAFPPDYLKRLTSSPPQNLAIISVKGESMEPTLVDDDIVLVDTSKTHMGFEGLFVLRHNDTLLVKRAGMAAKNGHVMLISDNKAYPPVEAALADLNVIGKVLWYGRKV